jgi:hypothetical protein
MSVNEVMVPNVGEEVLVNITPSIRSDRKWMQFGNVLAARQDPIGLICGTVQITRKMTAAENPDGWQSDGLWTGCVVSVVHNPYDNHWRATQPVCGRSKEVWCNVWGLEAAPYATSRGMGVATSWPCSGEANYCDQHDQIKESDKC